MTSKGVMHASLTIVAVAPASAAPRKLVSATVSPKPFFAASYTAKCTACAGLHSISKACLSLKYTLVSRSCQKHSTIAQPHRMPACTTHSTNKAIQDACLRSHTY